MRLIYQIIGDLFYNESTENFLPSDKIKYKVEYI